MTIPNFRPGLRVAGRLSVLALLIALPFGCDDDGTSPPDPDVDELPDTIPSGTYEVDDLLVEEGDTFTVDGDVVVVSSGTVVIEGAVLVEPGGSLAIAAEDSLIVLGQLGPAAGATPDAAVRAVSPRQSPQDGGDPLRIAGGNVRIGADAEVEGFPLTIATIGAGTIRIDGSIRGADGISSTERDVPGGRGGDLHIGDAVANEGWDALEEAGLSIERPARLILSQRIHSGLGGEGFDDATGTLIGGDLFAVGSDGGDGGDIHISAGVIQQVATDELYGIVAGGGGAGGSCGLDHGSELVVLQGADGGGRGQRGADVTCATGAGGDGGQVFLETDGFEGDTYISNGMEGGRGDVILRSGNGGPGGRGGNVEIRLAGPGLDRRIDAPPGETPFQLDIQPGGNGGDSDGLDMAGGNGGSISILDPEGGPVITDDSFYYIRSESFSGGAGYSGCLALPYGPGTPGGAAGTLIIEGGKRPLLVGDGASFVGGAGSDGSAPGAGGSGGFDDAGERLGPDGSAGNACNPPATVTSVEANEEVLDEVTPVELVILGTEFGTSCVIRVNGVPVTGQCETPTEATATVPPAQQQHGDNEVCVVAGAPGGGSAGCGTFVLSNPPAVIDSVVNRPLVVGAPDVTLRIYGQFRPNPVFTIGGEPAPITGQGPGWYEVVLPGSRLTTTGQMVIGATNAAPAVGGDEASLTVHGAVTLGDPDPPTVPRFQSTSVRVPVIGAFVEGDSVFVNGVRANWVDNGDGTILVDITAQSTQNTGPVAIVFNNGTGSAATHAQVVNPPPVITALSQEEAAVNSGPLRLYVYGQFVPEVQFFFAGAPIVPDSSGVDEDGVTYYVLTIENELVDEEMQTAVEAVHPGNLVDQAPFLVYGGLVLDEPDVTHLTRFGPDTVVHIGFSGHVTDETRVLVNGAPTDFVIDGTTLAVTITAEQRANAGFLDITADNGAESNTVTVEVANPAPHITGLSQEEALVNSGPVTIRIYGQFVPEVIFLFDGVEIEADSSGVDDSGDQWYDITVSNELLSEEKLTSIVALHDDFLGDDWAFRIFGALVLGQPDSARIMAGSGDTQVRIPYEGHITEDTRVLVNGVQAEYVDEGSSLLVTVTQEQLSASGQLEITADNGAESNTVTIDVRNRDPILNSIEPPDRPVGSPETVVTLHGADIAPGAVVWFGGIAYRDAVRIDANTIQITVAAEVFEEPGNLPVWIENLDADSVSAILPFIIHEPVHLLPLSVASLPRGGGDTTIVVAITGVYTTGAQVLVNGQPVPTEHIGEGLLRATVTSDKLTGPGALDITVEDKGLQSENSQQIALQNQSAQITSLSPSGALLGAGEFTVTAEVANLYPGETILRQDGEIIEYVNVPGDQGRIQFDVDGAEFAGAAFLLFGVENPDSPILDGLLFSIGDPNPHVEEVEPATVATGFAGEVTISGTNFQPGATVYAEIDGVPQALETSRLSDTQLAFIATAILTQQARELGIYVVNPDDAFPVDWARGPTPFQSAVFNWVITDAINRCLVYTGLTYGELFGGELDDDDCTIGTPPNHEHQDYFHFTSSNYRSLVTFVGTETSYARPIVGGAPMDYVFSFGGAADTKTILTPTGQEFDLVVSSNSGGVANLSYSITVGPAMSNGLNQCFGDVMARPLVGMPIMLQDMIDAQSCNRWVGHTVLVDEGLLAYVPGDVFRISVNSETMPLDVYVSCSGPCSQSLFTGVPTGPNSSMLEFTVPEDADGSLFKFWVASRNGTHGSYDLTIELNPEPLPVDVCNRYEQNLPQAQYGTTVAFTLDSDDCADGPDNFFELFEIITGQTANQLDLDVEIGEFMLYDRDGNQVGEWSSTMRYAFLPPGEYIAQPITIFGILPVTGTMNIGPTTGEITSCMVNSAIWPGAAVTQTLRDELEDYSCSASGTGNERRLYDNFDMLVPPGRTVVFTQSSTQVDPVLYLDPDPSGSGAVIVDDNSGGGTTARIAYTNAGSTPQRIVINPSTNFFDTGEPGGTGTYTLTAEWGP